ncbi:MAG: DUF1049 domain-containing protein [Gammaproteobacteria bacterium]|nr:DUF1049 domain-containing protein [Gammaproteobacteria bacterium]
MVRRIIQVLTALCGVLVGLAFHARNHALVRLDFYRGALELPLSFVVVGSLLAGTLLGAAVLLPGRWRLARRLRRSERAASAAQALAIAARLPVAPPSHVD